MSSFTIATSSADVTREVTRGLDLPEKTLNLYRTLHTVGVEVVKARRYPKPPTEVTFFVPGEIVAFAIDWKRSTMYDHLAKLRRLGLVDYRGHYTQHRGRTKRDGVVWCVKLVPFRGRAVRLARDYLQRKWRDLSGDIERGRTAWAEIRQSKALGMGGRGVNQILAWALPKKTQSEQSPLSVTVGFGLDALLDVPYARRRDRGEAVNTAAKAMASALRDDSLDFYRWLLWRLLRRWDRSPEDHWHSLHEMVLRASADREEGFARSAGALFVSRLKRWALWGDLRVMDDLAVGPPPT